ncbi:hypothetical protein ACP275_05G004900 [Erythranthe tilingii]
MAAFVVGLVFVLAMTGYSDASYCVCNSGVSDAVLQKNIDYACGAGADCIAIMQNGACFSPNTVKDHCNYAVNSYYQKKAQITGSCDFQGTAAVTQTAPSAAPGCVYQASPRFDVLSLLDFNELSNFINLKILFFLLLIFFVCDKFFFFFSWCE